MRPIPETRPVSDDFSWRRARIRKLPASCQCPSLKSESANSFEGWDCRRLLGSLRVVATSLSARAIGTETLTVGGTSQPNFSRPSPVTKSSGGSSFSLRRKSCPRMRELLFREAKPLHKRAVSLLRVIPDDDPAHLPCEQVTDFVGNPAHRAGKPVLTPTRLKSRPFGSERPW